MSKIIQKLLESMRLNPEDDEDDEDFETKPEPAKNKPEMPVRERYKRPEISRSSFDDEDDEEDDEMPVRRPMRKSEEISRPARPAANSGRTMVSMRSNYSSNSPSDICILHPKCFEDSQEICDMLKAGRVIFVNFENLGAEHGQRVMDFISGAVYSLDANIHQISNFNFVIAPDKVEISGDYIDSLKEGTFEVPLLLGNH